ncbi:hypothetical protein [Mycolicibacterium sp.]
MTPVTQATLALPDIQIPSANQVVLAGFDNPLSELLLSAGLANLFTFDTDAPMFPVPAPWSTPATNGLLPQIINDHLPIVSQLGLNGSDYLFQTGKGFGTSALLLSEGFWNAAGQALSFDIPGAITTVVDAITAAGEEALATGQYVLTGVVTRAAAVATALATLTPEIATAVVNQGLVVAGAFVKVFQDAVDALQSTNPIENTWNAVVDGLFGPTGVPGALTAITIGPGVLAPAPIGAFVPSVRTVISTVVKDVATALATPNPAPAPTAAKKASPSASSLRVAAAETSAPADNSGADNAKAGDSGSSATDHSNSSNAKSGSAGKSSAKHGVGGSKRAKASASKSSE